MTAMCYGEYFPSPAGLEGAWRARLAAAPTRTDPEQTAGLIEPLRQAQHELVPHGTALLAEVLGTMILALVVFALTDPRNEAVPAARLAPVFIGLTVAILISVIGPLTQACFNPARDFGPRLVAWIGGWGEIALPGPRGLGFLTVYIIAPVVGALLGGKLYDHVLRPHLPAIEDKKP
jgi:glycerol uptake facilitator protein